MRIVTTGPILGGITVEDYYNSTDLVQGGTTGEDYYILEGATTGPILGVLQVRITTTDPILGGMYCR